MTASIASIINVFYNKTNQKHTSLPKLPKSPKPPIKPPNGFVFVVEEVVLVVDVFVVDGVGVVVLVLSLLLVV